MSYKKETCVLCGSEKTRDYVSFKKAKTIKEYVTKAFGYSRIVVPVGSIVSNHTACGNDDNYRFWNDWHKVAEEITGFKNSILADDLTYYGLTVPAEFCEPYQD